MSTPKQQSNATVIVIGVVVVAVIAALVLPILILDKSQVPEGWAATGLGLIVTIVNGIFLLNRVQAMDSKVDDLGNGKMDRKMEDAVARVLARHGMTEQSGEIESAAGRERDGLA